MNIRDGLLRKARKNNDYKSWQEYKQKRNKCTNQVRKAKSTYHQHMLDDNSKNPQKFWETIKSITQSLPNYVNSKERAKHFANYFTNIVGSLKSTAFPLVNFIWRYNPKRNLRTEKIFRFSFVSVEFVERQLRRLKRDKATGTDSLPSNLLKDCALVIAPPLTHIINMSLETSTFPSIWKSAKITPIYKSGNLDHVENYRPISVLPILSKILEKVVHQQLYDFLETNKLLYNCQFGFRKKRSTKLAATLFCDTIRKGIDSGLLVGSLFIDLSKAFDSIGHGILIEKLMLHGVCGPELAWFTDYLFDRKQVVQINGTLSEPYTVKSGVPQGSILGPLMFIVFFNDLKDNINSCDIFQYADDTVIFFADKNIQTVEDALNNDLKSIGQYCIQNELILNLKPGKTEAMLFGTSKRLKQNDKILSIIYNNTKINFVTNYVYLGNKLDQNLSLSPNFERSYKKASGRLRLLQSVRNHLNAIAAKSIYQMMILPILTYSCTVKTTFNNTQLAKFKSLERRATEIIGSGTVKSIQDIINAQICSLVSKCMKRSFDHDVLDD